MTKVEDNLSKLFVYGIFLSERLREAYYMKDASYDTVANFSTVGKGGVNSTIVEAVVDEGKTLTGLVVDVEPTVVFGDSVFDNWDRLDKLEHGYDRVKITTNSGVEAWMYKRS